MLLKLGNMCKGILSLLLQRAHLHVVAVQVHVLGLSYRTVHRDNSITSPGESKLNGRSHRFRSESAHASTLRKRIQCALEHYRKNTAVQLRMPRGKCEKKCAVYAKENAESPLDDTVE